MKVGPLRLPAATAHAVGRGLRFDAPAVVSREFLCVSTLPLWFRANSGLFWLAPASFPHQCLHNGVLTFRVKELVAGRNGARGGGAGPWFRRSRCGFARIRASSGLFWGGHLEVAGRNGARGGVFVRIPLRFDVAAVVSRASRRVSIARIPASSGIFWGGHLDCGPHFSRPLLASFGPPHCLGSTPAEFYTIQKSRAQ